MNNAHPTNGFAQDDRKRATRGLWVSLAGGVVMAGVRAAGFILRALFGGEAWGLYAIAWSLTELFAFFVVGGFNDAVVIFASRVRHGQSEAGDEQYRALATILVVPLILSLALACAVHWGAPVLYTALWAEHDTLLVDLIRTLAWSLPLLVLVQVPVEATRATLKFGAVVGIVNIAFPFLSLLIAIGLYYAGHQSILAVAQAAFLALALCVPASLWAYSRHFDLKRTLIACVSLPWKSEVLKFAFPQSLNMMLNQGLNRIDSLMLSFLGISANTIGVYSLVSELTQLIRLAKMAFSGVFSPLVAKYRAQSNHQGVLEALDSIARKTSSLGIVLVLLVMSLWPLFIFQASETWSESLLFPWLLCVGPISSAFFGLCGNALLMYGHSRMLLVNAMVSGTLNVVLNVLLIPHWGVLGAAFATAIANLTISSLQVIELWKLERIRPRFEFYGRTLLGAAPFVALVFYLTFARWPATGSIDGVSQIIARSCLAAGAALGYVVLQWVLPGQRPFGNR